MTRKQFFLLAGGLVLAFALGAVFHHFFYFAQEPRGNVLQGEAVTNPFLAAKRLIQRMDHPATTLRGLPKPLPPTGDTLVLPWRRFPMTDGQAEALADWVEKGGTLLAEGLEPEEEADALTRDPLFRAFEARLLPAERHSEPAGDLPCTVDGVAMVVDIGSGLRLKNLGSDPKGQAQNADGIQVLQFAKGQGRCYLMTRMPFLRGTNLFEKDHATFFCALALDEKDPARRGGRVWIVIREEPLSAWAWLHDHAGPILLSLAALALALLWASMPRFGPLQEAPDLSRRRFLEHLDASGSYHWRHAAGRPLLKACQDAFHRRLGHAHPAWTHLDGTELCARLAAHTGLPESRIFQALRYDTAMDPAAYLDAIQTLELLRKQL